MSRTPPNPRATASRWPQALWDKYGDAFKPDTPSLTTGRPATCSSSLPPYPARLANDGFALNTDRYWATDVGKHPGPAWWQVDLQEPAAVGRVVVVGYYGDARHYGFTVETSLDGATWDMVADRRDNADPATAEGYTCRFDPRPVRYIRVTQLTTRPTRAAIWSKWRRLKSRRVRVWHPSVQIPRGTALFQNNTNTGAHDGHSDASPPAVSGSDLFPRRNHAPS